jgi:DNA-binding NarL/FixJ family response regulator
MVMDPQLRVGVVAHDPLRLLGLQTILEESAGLLSRAVRLEDALVPEDVAAEGEVPETLAAVLLDSVSVPDLLEVLAQFQRERPAAKVVVVGEELDPRYIEAVIAAGAKGYLSASANETEIRAALEAVLGGSVWAPRRVLAKLIGAGSMTLAPVEGAERCSDHMTRRELELLGLLKTGRTNRQIAEAMGIEAVTVKAHVGRMLRKAGVKNRVELTLRALAEGPGKV